MDEPTITVLHYKLKHTKSVTFKNPSAVEGEWGGFRYQLVDGKLTITLPEGDSDFQRAMQVVDPWVRSWEIAAGIGHPEAGMEFEFDGASTMPADPTKRISFGSIELRPAISGTPYLSMIRKTYPKPPSAFQASAEVQILWHRFKQYKHGKEPLASMAYACLSFLEGTTGQKHNARQLMCQKYCIDRAVRDKLGDLISERGGPDVARKMDHGATLQELTHIEIVWVEDVILALIRRKGEYDHAPDTSFALITLADFPQI